MQSAQQQRWRRMTAMTKKKLEVFLQRSGCDYTERIRYLSEIHLPQCLLSQTVDCFEDTIMRNRKSGGNSKVKRKPKYLSGNCAKVLGKGSRQKRSIWCNNCGLVHFTCSCLKLVEDYKKSRDFFCPKCALPQKIVKPAAESLAYSKNQTFWTSCNNPAAFDGRNALMKTSNCSYRQVDNYINRSETYTKIKQRRNSFPLSKVQSFRLYEFWFIDLAGMQKLSRYNHRNNFIFVALNTLNRFVWALPLKKRLLQNLKMLCRKSWNHLFRKESVKNKDDDETDVLSVQVKCSAETKKDFCA